MISRRKVILGVSTATVVIVAGILGVWVYRGQTTTPEATVQPSATASVKSKPTAPPTEELTDQLTGEKISVSDKFHILVPGGWRASVSTQLSFLAVQFARPGQLESLVYDKAQPATVDYDGIPAWSGLTEHFYVRAITAPSQAFNPANHAEVTSEPFTFNDRTVGKKYLVTKHAAEAQKWGGLLKDDVWYGRVFIYPKGETTVEAHLAFYPSTNIDQKLFEKVAATVEQ